MVFWPNVECSNHFSRLETPVWHLGTAPTKSFRHPYSVISQAQYTLGPLTTPHSVLSNSPMSSHLVTPRCQLETSHSVSISDHPIQSYRYTTPTRPHWVISEHLGTSHSDILERPTQSFRNPHSELLIHFWFATRHTYCTSDNILPSAVWLARYILQHLLLTQHQCQRQPTGKYVLLISHNVIPVYYNAVYFILTLTKEVCSWICPWFPILQFNIMEQFLQFSKGGMTFIVL